MKLAAEVQDLHKVYVLGPSVDVNPGGAKRDLQYAPLGADEGRILVKALRGVSVTFPEGDFVAIMGASGSGKSTLLNVLGGLDRPTKGHYVLGGVDVSQMNDAELSLVRNQRIGFIFQSYNLIAQYTVLENIELPLQYRPGYPAISADDRNRCLNLAKKVGLGDRLDHRPFQLSGGQQQRVAIARAMVNDPDIILADEPTGNLDSATSHEIMEMLTSLNREGRTIIMVTHEPDIAEWAKRQIVMRDGVVNKETRTKPV
jgi:putative ABC transport system ATP-binding protein